MQNQRNRQGQVGQVNNSIAAEGTENGSPIQVFFNLGDLVFVAWLHLFAAGLVLPGLSHILACTSSSSPSASSPLSSNHAMSGEVLPQTTVHLAHLEAMGGGGYTMVAMSEDLGLNLMHPLAAAMTLPWWLLVSRAVVALVVLPVVGATVVDGRGRRPAALAFLLLGAAHYLYLGLFGHLYYTASAAVFILGGLSNGLVAVVYAALFDACTIAAGPSNSACLGHAAAFLAPTFGMITAASGAAYALGPLVGVLLVDGSHQSASVACYLAAALVLFGALFSWWRWAETKPLLRIPQGSPLPLPRRWQHPHTAAGAPSPPSAAPGSARRDQAAGVAPVVVAPGGSTYQDIYQPQSPSSGPGQASGGQGPVQSSEHTPWACWSLLWGRCRRLPWLLIPLVLMGIGESMVVIWIPFLNTQLQWTTSNVSFFMCALGISTALSQAFVLPALLKAPTESQNPSDDNTSIQGNGDTMGGGASSRNSIDGFRQVLVPRLCCVCLLGQALAFAFYSLCHETWQIYTVLALLGSWSTMWEPCLLAIMAVGGDPPTSHSLQISTSLVSPGADERVGALHRKYQGTLQGLLQGLRMASMAIGIPLFLELFDLFDPMTARKNTYEAFTGAPLLLACLCHLLSLAVGLCLFGKFEDLFIPTALSANGNSMQYSSV